MWVPSPSSAFRKPPPLPKSGDGGPVHRSDPINGMSIPASDFDGAWEETVEVFLQPLLELILTTVARVIDWSRGFEFLDSELRALFPNTRSRRRVDKLIRVFFRDGRARWIYLHLEIQSQASKDTPKRMFLCFYRIYDPYGMPLLSIALLVDPDTNHRPGPLDLRVAGSGCLFQCHTCKLTDFTDAFLEASPNPVAKVILAHRITQRTAKDPTARMHAKVQWIRELFRQGFSRDQITTLFQALEAMNPLPDELGVEFRDKVLHVVPDKAMPIITSFERLARKEALAEGLSKGLSQGRTEGRTEGQLSTLRDAIRDLLEERFGHTPPALGECLEQEANPAILKVWLRKTATVESVDAFLGMVSR